MSERWSSRRPKGAIPRDLSYITSLGAKTRQHRYFRDISLFLLPVFVAIVAQSVVYFALFTRTGRTDWPNAGLVVFALAWVPVLSAMTLGAFRRHEAPIIAAVGISAVFFSFAVTALSAFRIPMSYLALATSFPIVAAIITYANIRFHSAIAKRVAVIAFNGDGLIKSLLEAGDLAIITHPDTDISVFDAILIHPAHHHTEQWSDLLTRCYIEGVDIIPWSRFMEVRLGRVDIASFDISHIAYSPSQLLYARVKRFLDVAAVLVTLPLSIPLAAMTALYIFARDGGPVFFVQLRRGLGGKVFRVYKFRTMRNGTGGGATLKSDKRIIPGCRLIRKLRLDELPQLYNILIGNMSVIGPRPEAVDLAKWYSREIPQWSYRTLVQPGLTGWAQVSSGYTSNPDEARVKLSYDLYYIKHLSFDLDLQILFKTVKTVLLGSGAR